MAQNVLGGELQPCSYNPLTGFFRDGCCNTGAEDLGVHTVCIRASEEFLAFSASVGNDLSTPHPEYGFDGLTRRPVVPLRQPLAGGVRSRHGAAGRPGVDPRLDLGVGAAQRPGPVRRQGLTVKEEWARRGSGGVAAVVGASVGTGEVLD